MAVSYFKKYYMKEEWMGFDKKLENLFFFVWRKETKQNLSIIVAAVLFNNFNLKYICYKLHNISNLQRGTQLELF